VIALVSTVAGTFAVDLETDEVEPAELFVPAPAPVLNLPRVIAAAAAGSTVIAVVDLRPPLVVSYDAGATWNESGRGLPAGRAVAIAEENPDTMVYGARNRLYLSRNGGVFWQALALELPEIEAVLLTAG
jgi:hypothetical protein